MHVCVEISPPPDPKPRPDPDPDPDAGPNPSPNPSPDPDPNPDPNPNRALAGSIAGGGRVLSNKPIGVVVGVRVRVSPDAHLSRVHLTISLSCDWDVGTVRPGLRLELGNFPPPNLIIRDA